MHEITSDSIVKQYGIIPPFILSVGHLLGFRNIVELIEAFAILRGQLALENLRLVIVGEEQFPGYLKVIHSAIQKYNLEDSVQLLGQIPHSNVGALMRGCEVFVFPSMCENCPTSLIEAMSQHVAIACSSFEPMPEIAGDAALYFDPRDPVDMARSIKVLIDNPLLRNDLKKRAYNRSRGFPSRREVATQTFNVLFEIASRCHGRVTVNNLKSRPDYNYGANKFNKNGA